MSHHESLTGSLHVPVQCDFVIPKGMVKSKHIRIKTKQKKRKQSKAHQFTDMALTFLNMGLSRQDVNSASAPHSRCSVSGERVLSADCEAL